MLRTVREGEGSDLLKYCPGPGEHIWVRSAVPNDPKPLALDPFRCPVLVVPIVTGVLRRAGGGPGASTVHPFCASTLERTGNHPKDHDLVRKESI